LFPRRPSNDMVHIRGLEQHCSFIPGADMVCEAPATSVVIDPDSPFFRPKFRCDRHRGMLAAGRVGETFDEMPVGLLNL
jgi:hypothetical protein